MKLAKLVIAYILLDIPLLVAESRQTLIIDSQHLLAEQNKSGSSSYSIKPTKVLVIDYSRYKFLPDKNGKIHKPDTVSMIIDSKRQYYYKITNSKTRHHLSEKTLLRGAGMKSFEGLKAGDKFVLAIGKLEQDKKALKQIFKVAWIGLVNVVP